MARFVVELTYGDDHEELLRVRPAHRDYLQQLVDRGVLLAAGPFVAGDGGLLVYDVADEDELRAVLDEDPYAKAGVLASTTVHEWNPMFGRWVGAA
jgi:uncharacterized protein YciI